MRQNIDEKWKTDPRRLALDRRIGRRLSDAMRVEINWLLLDHRGKPIPLKIFNFVENAADWIECGLARIEGDVVVVAGANHYDAFFEKQRLNGMKGGRPPENPDEPNETQNNPEEPKITQTKPENPSYSFSPSFSKTGTGTGSSSNQELRFSFANETEKVRPFLASFFPGSIPREVDRLIPRMILACDGDPDRVIAELEDLYQSPKIRTGTGVTGSKSSYVFAAIMKRFGLDEGVA